MFGFRHGISRLSLISTTAIGLVLATTSAFAQVTPSGGTTNILNTGTGITQTAVGQGVIGAGGNGTTTVVGTDTLLEFTNSNAFPSFGDAELQVGTNSGTGFLHIHGGGTVTIEPDMAGGDDAFLRISEVPGGGFSPAAMQGTVIVGNDPNTIANETGGTLKVNSASANSNNDASIDVGREGPGIFIATDSMIEITTTGTNTSDSALFQIGGRSGSNNNATAVGNVTISNSTVTVDAQGAGASVVSVGRGTAHPNPATAPENTLLIDNGSTFDNVATGTGAATFNVARDGTRGTATIDGENTTLNVDDTINIGRDGGLGTMNIQNDGVVNNTASVDNAIVRVGTDAGAGPAVGGGTLNVNSGGTLNISSATGGDDAFLFVSEGTMGGTSMQGAVNVASGGKINITAGNNGTDPTGPGSGNDAVLGVGREGPGSFTATDSTINITALGARNIDNATVDIGGGGPSNITGAVGNMTLTNSDLTVQTSGAGAFASIIVGRGTTAANAASAPENTFVAEAGTVVTVQGLDTGNAGFTAGDNGTKATVTFRGTGTTLNVDDFVNVGRRSALGVMNVEDNAVINNNIDPTSRTRVGRQGGTGTLNINTGGVFNGTLVEIGADSTGTLNITDGGTLNSAGTTIISNGAGTMGTATVSGNGSKLDAGSALTPATFSLIVGVDTGSDGSLTANMGGDVIARTTMGVGTNGGKGVVDIDGVGSSLTVTNGLFIADGTNGDGMVTVRNGATASAEHFTVGANQPAGATSVGILKIQNGSSAMTTGTPLFDRLDVGRHGTGVVEISGNSQFTSTGATAIGNEVSGIGTVTVTGNGSQLNSNDTIRVGHSGKGTLDVTQGGEVNTRQILIAGAGGDGTVNVTGAGSKINVERTGPGPSAFFGVGGNTGGGTNTGGTLKINDGGELNINADASAGDALLFISSSFAGGAPVTLPGTVIIGDDPSTGTVESGGTINIQSDADDAEIAVGRAGQGTLMVKDSDINIITTGLVPGNSAQFQIGGRSGGNVNNNAIAVGNVTIDNSTFTMDAQGAGATVLNLGRSTNTVSNPDPMTAPESTLVIENGSTVDVKNTGTGSATMSVGRDGARATATIDGIGTTLTVDDTINIGRDGGFGTMHVQNSGTVTNKGNTTNIAIGSPGSTGMLNVNTGGTFNEATTINVGSAGNTGTLNVDGGGNVVIGFDPITGPGITGNSPEDAIVSVGLEEVGTLNVTNNSALKITATGLGSSDSSLLQIGGRFDGAPNNTANARGDVLIDNSTVTMDASGAGSTVVSVGRGIDSTIHTDPATAPENTLTIQNGSIFNVKNTGSGSAFFNVARDNTRGTATIDGTGTTLNTEDFMNIGRDGGSGTMNIQNNATVNHMASVGDALVRVGRDAGVGPAGGGGTLNVNSGGTLNISSATGGDDAFLFISEGSSGGTSMQGAVNVASGGKINITAGNNLTNSTGPGSGNDAVLGVGREGPGSFTATDSTINVTALGSRNIDNATVDIGGGGPSNISGAVGDMTLTNSDLTVQTNGAGAFASIIVGRSTTETDPNNAANNTFVAEAGSVVTVQGLSTGNAGFTVGDRGTKATVTFRGAGTTLNVDDFVNIGRRSAIGIMNVEDNAVINANIDATARTRIGRDRNGPGTPLGNGTLNINTGGKFHAVLVENGVFGTGTINVSNGGALFANNIVNGANGTLTGGGGTITGMVTAETGSVIAPGNSTGLMTVFGDVDLMGGSTLEIELGGTNFDTGLSIFEYDRLFVQDDLSTTGIMEGIVTIDPGSIFDISEFGAFNVDRFDTFDIIVADSIIGDISLSTFILPGILPGQDWITEIVTLGNGDQALRLRVVSEPGTLLVLLGGLSAIAIVRRRRRRT